MNHASSTEADLKLMLPKAISYGCPVPPTLLQRSAGLKYVEALGRIIIGGPYPPSNAIMYVHL